MTQRDDDDNIPGGAAVAHAHGHVEVDCRRLSNLLGDYVDGQLPTDVKSAVDSHMSQCAPCMAFLKQYRFGTESARKMLLKAVPAELEERVLSFLRNRCKKDGSG